LRCFAAARRKCSSLGAAAAPASCSSTERRYAADGWRYQGQDGLPAHPGLSTCGPDSDTPASCQSAPIGTTLSPAKSTFCLEHCGLTKQARQRLFGRFIRFGEHMQAVTPLRSSWPPACKSAVRATAPGEGRAHTLVVCCKSYVVCTLVVCCKSYVVHDMQRTTWGARAPCFPLHRACLSASTGEGGAFAPADGFAQDLLSRADKIADADAEQLCGAGTRGAAHLSSDDLPLLTLRFDGLGVHAAHEDEREQQTDSAQPDEKALGISSARPAWHMQSKEAGNPSEAPPRLLSHAARQFLLAQRERRSRCGDLTRVHAHRNVRHWFPWYRMRALMSDRRPW